VRLLLLIVICLPLSIFGQLDTIEIKGQQLLKGEHFEHYENGNLKNHLIYDFDYNDTLKKGRVYQQLIFIKSLFENGDTIKVRYFDASLNQYIEREYFESGQLLFKGNYNLKLFKEGKHHKYYKNGILKEVVTYEKGNSLKIMSNYESGMVQAVINVFLPSDPSCSRDFRRQGWSVFRDEKGNLEDAIYQDVRINLNSIDYTNRTECWAISINEKEAIYCKNANEEEIENYYGTEIEQINLEKFKMRLAESFPDIDLPKLILPQ